MQDIQYRHLTFFNCLRSLQFFKLYLANKLWAIDMKRLKIEIITLKKTRTCILYFSFGFLIGLFLSLPFQIIWWLDIISLRTGTLLFTTKFETLTNKQAMTKELYTIRHSDNFTYLSSFHCGNTTSQETLKIKQNSSTA